MSEDIEFIKDYFKGKRFDVSVISNNKMHHFTTEAILEAILNSKPHVHKFVADRLKEAKTKADVKRLVESIAETFIKENYDNS